MHYPPKWPIFGSESESVILSQCVYGKIWVTRPDRAVQPCFCASPFYRIYLCNTSGIVITRIWANQFFDRWWNRRLNILNLIFCTIWLVTQLWIKLSLLIIIYLLLLKSVLYESKPTGTWVLRRYIDYALCKRKRALEFCVRSEVGCPQGAQSAAQY